MIPYWRSSDFPVFNDEANDFLIVHSCGPCDVESSSWVWRLDVSMRSRNPRNFKFQPPRIVTRPLQEPKSLRPTKKERKTEYRSQRWDQVNCGVALEAKQRGRASWRHPIIVESSIRLISTALSGPSKCKVYSSHNRISILQRLSASRRANILRLVRLTSKANLSFAQSCDCVRELIPHLHQNPRSRKIVNRPFQGLKSLPYLSWSTMQLESGITVLSSCCLGSETKMRSKGRRNMALRRTVQ
jgi:hypothetical protein